MDITQTLNDLIFFLGVVALILELCLGFYFLKIDHPFSRAFSAGCFAGVIVCLATLIFSASSILGAYGQLDPWFVIFLRFSIFGALLASSWYLWWRVRKS